MASVAGSKTSEPGKATNGVIVFVSGAVEAQDNRTRLLGDLAGARHESRDSDRAHHMVDFSEFCATLMSSGSFRRCQVAAVPIHRALINGHGTLYMPDGVKMTEHLWA